MYVSINALIYNFNTSCWCSRGISVCNCSCTYSFNSTPSDNQESIDICTAIVLNLSNGKVVVSSADVKRLDGTDTFGLPTGFCGLNDKVAFFAACESANGTLWDAPISVAATVTA